MCLFTYFCEIKQKHTLFFCTGRVLTFRIWEEKSLSPARKEDALLRFGPSSPFTEAEAFAFLRSRSVSEGAGNDCSPGAVSGSRSRLLKTDSCFKRCVLFPSFPGSIITKLFKNGKGVFPVRERITSLSGRHFSPSHRPLSPFRRAGHPRSCPPLPAVNGAEEKK